MALRFSHKSTLVTAIFVAVGVLCVYANPPAPVVRPEVKQEKPTKEIYDFVEQQPAFPGGEKALYEFLAKNIVCPEQAYRDSVQGRVVLRFIVTETGEIDNVQILRSVAPALDEEARRVILAMPKWVPGKQNGKEVAVRYVLSVLFKIPEAVVEKPKHEIISFTDPTPSYPGGEAKLREFIYSNLCYPEQAAKEGIQGRVTLRFRISETGYVDNKITVLRSDHPLFDAEAIRVVKLMPKWIPAISNTTGKAIPTYFTLPIVFKLPEKVVDKQEPTTNKKKQ